MAPRRSSEKESLTEKQQWVLVLGLVFVSATAYFITEVVDALYSGISKPLPRQQPESSLRGQDPAQFNLDRLQAANAYRKQLVEPLSKPSFVASEEQIQELYKPIDRKAFEWNPELLHTEFSGVTSATTAKGSADAQSAGQAGSENADFVRAVKKTGTSTSPMRSASASSSRTSTHSAHKNANRWTSKTADHSTRWNAHGHSQQQVTHRSHVHTAKRDGTAHPLTIPPEKSPETAPRTPIEEFLVNKTAQASSTPPSKPHMLCGGAQRPWNPFKVMRGASAARSLLSSSTFREHETGVDRNDVANPTFSFLPRRKLQQRTGSSNAPPAVDLKDKETPLRQAYCKGKGEYAAPPALELSVKESALLVCMKGGHRGCPPSRRADAVAAAQALPGMKLLVQGPPCYTVVHGSSDNQCTSYQGNVETEAVGAYPNSAASRPSYDYRWKQWGSCALVGRSPVIKIEENGRAIDKHDAVWRFNLQSTKGYSNYIGKKTHLRLINNGDSLRASQGLGGKTEASMFAVGKEDWVFWQYNSIANMKPFKQKLKANTRLLAPAFIKWQMDVYFTLKKDLEELGLGPYFCPTSVSSGMHAALMGMALCDRVSLFGYSYYGQMLTTRMGHNNGPQPLFQGHSWKFDTALIRLLHIAGKVDICTADVPEIPVNVLRNAKGRDYR